MNNNTNIIFKKIIMKKIMVAYKIMNLNPGITQIT